LAAALVRVFEMMSSTGPFFVAPRLTAIESNLRGG
jgi:hypothetical protein